MPQQRPSGLTAARLTLWIGAATAASFVFFAWIARFPVPYRDDWDWLAWVLGGPVTLARLLQRHNEHLIPLPRLLAWVQYRLAGANGHLFFWLALAAQAAIVGLVLREIARRWPDETHRSTREAAYGASLVLLCFSWQLQSIVFAAATIFPFVQAFAIVSIVALVDASESPRPRPALAAIALIATVLAMATTSNGLAVPVVIAVLVYTRRTSWWIAGAAAALALAGAVLFLRLVLESQPANPSAPLAFARVGDAARYFCAFFVPYVTYQSGTLGTVVGGALALAGAFVVIRVLVERRAAPRIEHVAAGVVLFVMASGAMAAVGRADLGIDQAAQSRYATYTLVYAAALVLAITNWMTRGAPAPARHRVIAVSTLLLAVVMLPAHLFTGLVWRAKANNVGAAGLAVAAGVHDDEWIETLHPFTSVVYDAVKDAVARGDRTLVDPRIGSHVDVAASLPSCGGAFATVTSRTGTLRLFGRVTTSLAPRALVLDTRGVVVGLAAPAPLVTVPNPPRAAFTVAVMRTWRSAGGSSDSGAWIGFANDTGARPLSIAGVDARGAAICREVVAEH